VTDSARPRRARNLETCFHLFRVDVDGSNLVQLADEQFHRITLWMDCNAATVGAEKMSDRDKRRLAEFAGQVAATGDQ